MITRPSVPFSCVFLEDADGTARCADCRRRLIDVEVDGCPARHGGMAVITAVVALVGTALVGSLIGAVSLVSRIWP